jgi:hypothetical protein
VPKISVFQEMPGKCLELDNMSVFHMVLCGIFHCVDSEKALINEEDRQERELHVELRMLVVETHPGRF